MLNPPSVKLTNPIWMAFDSGKHKTNFLDYYVSTMVDLAELTE